MNDTAIIDDTMNTVAYIATFSHIALVSLLFIIAERSNPPMTGGWAVVALAVVGLIDHSARSLVRLLG